MPPPPDVDRHPRDFYPRFFRLGIVNILSNLMVPLAGLVDVAFLGHLDDLKYLAGVAIATVLFDYLYRMAKFLRMGTTGPTAQAAGRDDTTEVLLTLLRNGLIALAIGVMILLLQMPIREIGFAILTAAPDVKTAGMDYFNARIWGAPAVLLNFVLIGWFVGREQGGKVLALSIVGNGANVLLDYWFVYRCGWAGTGVGLATAISQYLMLFLGVMFIGLGGWFTQLRAARTQIWDVEAMQAIFKLNGDIWIRSCVNVSISAVFIGLSASFGTLILAGNTLLLHVVVLTTYLVDGLAFATESLAGSFQGAGTINKLAPLLKVSLSISLGIGMIAAGLFVLLPTPLFGLLTNHTEVISQVSHYVLWLFPVLGLGSIAFMLNGYFLGLTESTIVRDSMVVSAVIGFIPLAGIAWWQHNCQELWLAMALFMVIRVVTQLHKVASTMSVSTEQ
ncbi:MATE family efflux transporter [filamentous cyanobacterium LEGE 11480]|uniref:MATE family efflux transporter n=2 Tax=Romeriopsis TaxID=2992131 RepID=A0A928VLH6_9CYAN|nr:MATE family efflux transporter [Romeriopsis navalis LEGE 11480]